MQEGGLCKILVVGQIKCVSMYLCVCEDQG